MIISMATANFYRIPFPKALAMIKQAGFEFVELDGYWKGGDGWETAQHLKGIQPKDAIQMVLDHGLKIASFHDMGGVIEQCVDSIIAPSTYEYLEHYDFPCLVFHTPCIQNKKAHRWQEYRAAMMADLEALAENRIVCIENMKTFDGYYVPILTPQEMLDFVTDTGISINIDTTHFAQCGVDVVSAAAVLKDRVGTIHLSDYRDGRAHVPVGDGDLDFTGFYRELNMQDLYMTTIECDIPFLCEEEGLAVESCRRLKEKVEGLISIAHDYAEPRRRP